MHTMAAHYKKIGKTSYFLFIHLCLIDHYAHLKQGIIWRILSKHFVLYSHFTPTGYKGDGGGLPATGADPGVCGHEAMGIEDCWCTARGHHCLFKF